MPWLLIVIGAHLVNALAFLSTKVLLDKFFKSSTALAIMVGILGMGVFILSPCCLDRPTWDEFALDIGAGIILIMALMLFNYCLSNFEVTRVVPIVGGAVPAFTWLLAATFLGEQLNWREAVAFILLLIGTVIIANIGKSKGKVTFNLVIFALGAGLFFAVYFVLSKYIFETQTFISGFIWTRLGSFIAAIVLLLFPRNSRELCRVIQADWKKHALALVAALGFGVSGFLLLNYAIWTGSVTIVNAMQGVQYAFLLIVVLLATKFFPKIIKEKFSSWILTTKIIGILFISAGVAILSLI
jgi:drug/metabolite transporter (DMT)-like permease